jgi:hypothetical protein
LKDGYRKLHSEAEKHLQNIREALNSAKLPLEMVEKSKQYFVFPKQQGIDTSIISQV